MVEGRIKNMGGYLLGDVSKLASCFGDIKISVGSGILGHLEKSELTEDRPRVEDFVWGLFEFLVFVNWGVVDIIFVKLIQTVINGHQLSLLTDGHDLGDEVVILFRDRFDWVRVGFREVDQFIDISSILNCILVDLDRS